jgi:uncharacterized protein YueI
MEKEDNNKWGQKDLLEQALLVGIHGEPELKHDERLLYLGELKERVIKKLTKEQVAEKAIYPAIFQALQDRKADQLVINGSISSGFISKYKELATRLHKMYTVRNDMEFQGDTGLLVISDRAVEKQEMNVESRRDHLRRLGVSTALIEAAGQKVCKECLAEISRADENERINYQQLTWIDRLTGERCPVHPS